MNGCWARLILQVNKYNASPLLIARMALSGLLYLQALSVRLLYNYIIAFVIWFHPWGEEQIKAASMLAL